MFRHAYLISTIICLLLLSAVSFAHEKFTGGASDMKKCMMMTSKSGDADKDFIKNMIPHHQMAVDMAQKELEKGKDGKARDLAKKIIEAQNKEIETMQGWLNDKEIGQ